MADKMHFRLTGQNDKEYFMEGPPDGYGEASRFVVNWDDCDLRGMAYVTRKMMAILNDRWDDEEYSYLDLTPQPDGDEDETYNHRMAEATAIMKDLLDNG